MNTEAIKELLYKMADDLLIIGHRNSEWTGLGPILEEDISFSSMAQDKIGQSMAVFRILNQLGEGEPDTVAFYREPGKFHCSQFVELPNGEYDFSLMRHFLYDHADQLRFEMLANSSFEPISKLARKVKGELKYHVYHANIWITKLGPATKESHARMQNALNACWNDALGMFEESPLEDILISEKIFDGELELKKRWLENIIPVLAKATLKIPESNTWSPVFGGRKGSHTEYLKPLVEEMGEVFRVDPKAEWLKKYMEDLVNELKHLVQEYAQKMEAISETDFSDKPVPGKWSRKEILGHLVDSAQNNLRRFIVTQYETPPPHIVYDQDFWVNANRYQFTKKEDIIFLWKLMNERICDVLKNMPVAHYEKECNTGKGQIELHALQWLANDYVKHMKYHLNQIIPGSFTDIVY